MVGVLTGGNGVDVGEEVLIVVLRWKFDCSVVVVMVIAAVMAMVTTTVAGKHW